MICPICSKDSKPEFRPFCSRHCADVDLGRWLNGSYAFPSTREEDIEETDLPSDSDAMSDTKH